MLEDKYAALFDPTKVERKGTYTREELVTEKEKLKKYLVEERPYLNPDLRVAHIAAGLGVKPYRAAELLHRGLGISFYDLINGLRIEEVKKRLEAESYDHMNILEIAGDCGFNSKSVFNKAFQKYTGLTPSAFRKKAAAARNGHAAVSETTGEAS